MTRKLLIILILTFLPILVFSQDIKNNSEIALSKKSGRILELKKSLLIEDDPENDFVLRSPGEVRVAPDDTIFIREWNKIYQIDKKGKFLRNYIKKGEGPGEVKFIGGFAFLKDRVLIESTNPKKMINFDLNGNFINENKINDKRYLMLKFYNNKKLFFIHSPFPESKNNNGFVNIPNILVKKPLKQNKTEDIISFPIKSYLFKEGGRPIGMISVCRLLMVMSNLNKLYVSNTSEYIINIVDISSGKIVLKFKRDYKRIKTPPDYKPSGGIMFKNKVLTIPGQKYLNDIKKLFLFKNNIWVITSTNDKAKGNLIDVFNLKGEYIDNFYFNSKGDILGVHKDYIFVKEKDEEENLTIIKYQVMN